MNLIDLTSLNPHFVLEPPASEDQLMRLADWNGAGLPSQLLELLSLANGICFKNPYLPEEADPEMWVYGCANIERETTDLRQIWRDLIEEGCVEDPHAFGDPEKYVVVAGELMGNSLAYRAEEPGRHVLVVIDHESLAVEAVEPQDLFELLPELDPYERE